MTEPTRSKEQRILVVMRQVLGRIVRETTPDPGLRHPLSQGCIDDIRQCFALIAAREQELAKEAGIEVRERPRFGDQPRDAASVPVTRIGKARPKDGDD